MQNLQGNDSFDLTRWTLIHHAAAPHDPRSAQALAQLLERYLPALRSHLVRRQHIDPHRADDLLQAFIARKILEYNLIARADPARGKFRTFLLTALDNFVRNQPPSAPATAATPTTERADPAPSPLHSLESDWARSLVAQTLSEMEAECRLSGRPDLWGVFLARVVHPILQNAPPEPYENLMQQFALRSPAQASNLLTTGKRMFERTLRSIIGAYAPGDAEIDAEIADLRTLLSNTER